MNVEKLCVGMCVGLVLLVYAQCCWFSLFSFLLFYMRKDLVDDGVTAAERSALCPQTKCENKRLTHSLRLLPLCLPTHAPTLSTVFFSLRILLLCMCLMLYIKWKWNNGIRFKWYILFLCHYRYCKCVPIE